MTDHTLEEAVNALVLAKGNKAKAARELGIATSTYKDQLLQAEKLGLKPTILPPDIATEMESLKLQHLSEIRELKNKLKASQRENLTADAVRKYIYGLNDFEPAIRKWDKPANVESGNPGTPIVLLSDFHWGEVVRAEQVNGLNAFNLEIAHKRLENCVKKSIDLAVNHMVNPANESIVLWLGGDMISGDIHTELQDTNEMPVMAVLHDLFEHLITAIDAYADIFANVTIVCNYGNHGRNTFRPRFKMAAETSFDWHLYCMLEKHFKATGADHIEFVIPTGFDILFPIHNTNYLFTHGDRIGTGGGNGIIGAIGPIARGTQKVIQTYAQINQHIDFVVMGHWHQHLRLPNAMVNNTLKGFDEYAMGLRFEPTPPAQSMWWTHPKWGVTFETQIWVDDTSTL